MGSANVGAFSGGIDSSSDSTDNRAIPKVLLECPVIGEQQPRAAQPGKRQNVFVIGTAKPLLAERSGLSVHGFIRYYANTTRSYCVGQPSGEIGIAAEFSEKFTAHYKSAVSLIQPIEEELPRVWAIIPKDLVSDIVVHDSAHIDYRPMYRRVSSLKNRL